MTQQKYKKFAKDLIKKKEIYDNIEIKKKYSNDIIDISKLQFIKLVDETYLIFEYDEENNIYYLILDSKNILNKVNSSGDIPFVEHKKLIPNLSANIVEGNVGYVCKMADGTYATIDKNKNIYQ